MSRRIRSIKPEILDDERTAALSHGAWRLFVSLWLLADDYGNFRAVPRQIGGAVFWGRDDSDAGAWLDELTSCGLVKTYRVKGQHYAHISGWHHQKVDKPGKPLCPGPELADDPEPVATHSRESRESPAKVSNDDGKPPETLAPDRDLDLDPDQEEDQDQHTPLAVASSPASPPGVALVLAGQHPPPDKPTRVSKSDADAAAVYAHWRSYHPKAPDGLRAKSKLHRLILDRLREFPLERLKLAIDGCHASPFHQGQNDRGTKYLDLDLILRDQGKTQRFAELAESPPDTRPGWMKATEDWLNEPIGARP